MIRTDLRQAKNSLSFSLHFRLVYSYDTMININVTSQGEKLMQLFEGFIFIILIVLMFLVFKFDHTKKRDILFVGGLLLVSLLIQTLAVQIKWQLYPVYVGALVLLTMTYLKTFKRVNINKVVRRTLIAFLSVLIFVSMLAVVALPMYDVPKPNGSYKIGTESFIITDDSRVELYDDENENRRFAIQMWYPAETTKGFKQVPWIKDGVLVSRGLARDIGLPFFMLDHTAEIMSNAYEKAPINTLKDKYPVIVLSHGWRGFRNLHLDYAESLASEGYIVVSIDHTYGSVATLFGKNDVAYLNLDALPPSEDKATFLAGARKLVNTYAGDITKTLDYLEEMNLSSDSRFKGKMDFSKVGLLGHSTGGGADVTAALSDDRISAVIGLDAWVEPVDQNNINQGLDIPSLFIRSSSWAKTPNNINLYATVEKSNSTAILYQIDGTTHYDFAMVYMYSPLTKLNGFSGSVNNRYLVKILNQMILDFFDETLVKKTNNKIDISQYDIVKVILEK